MTEDTGVPPHTIVERVVALETRLDVVEQKIELLGRALRAAFGERWMDELKGRGNESTG